MVNNKTNLNIYFKGVKLKKFIIVLSVLTFAILNVFLIRNLNPAVNTNSSNINFAKITSKNCYLLKTPTLNFHYSNTLFIIEESYFVSIISNNEDFYYVNYNNLNGYVKKDDLVLVNETPKSPFLTDITFSVNTPCSLFIEPNAKAENEIQKLNQNQTLTYLGKIIGNEEIAHAGNIWYYCKLTENNTSIYGYIYASYVSNLTPITKNQEVTTNIISINNKNNLLYLNNTTTNILIIIVTVPSLFILYLFLKGFKKA